MSLLVLSGLATLVHFTLLGLLAFLASVDNVPVSLFLSSARTDMLPLRLRGMMESTLDVRVAAVSGALIALPFVPMVLKERLVGLTRRMRG